MGSIIAVLFLTLFAQAQDNEETVDLVMVCECQVFNRDGVIVPANQNDNLGLPSENYLVSATDSKVPAATAQSCMRGEDPLRACAKLSLRATYECSTMAQAIAGGSGLIQPNSCIAFVE